MTSTFATNFVSSKLSKKRYLETNSEGQPLQGQVPLTYQVYNGTGNETVVYDGSDVFVLDSTLAAGPLTIDFSDTQNLLGRSTQFIAFRALTNNCTMDFGTGSIYSPPSTVSANTFVLVPASSPTTLEWTYINTTTAVLSNSTAFPADPPKTLTFKISTDPTNDLNTITATRVQFDATTGSNDTTLTLGEAAPDLILDYTVVDATKYSISYSIFSVHDPSIALRGFIGINGDLYCYMESSLGITGQTLSGTLTIDLAPGDVIGVYVGNAAGAVTPIVPTTDYYGLLCITQF